MSRMRTEHYTCPNCGHENEFTMWQSLNGDMNPEAKQRLLDGTLFQMRCDQCGNEVELVYTLLYNDMRHRAMVYFVDEADVEHARKLLAQTRQTFEATTDIKLPPIRNRVVTSADDLREKAVIFENDLDDRVVEIVKVLYLCDALQRHPDIEKVFFMVDGGEYVLEAFGNRVYHTDIRHDAYARIRDRFAARLEAMGDEECVIGLKWAMEFLKEKG